MLKSELIVSDADRPAVMLLNIDFKVWLTHDQDGCGDISEPSLGLAVDSRVVPRGTM
jgi:hypothetical protein